MKKISIRLIVTMLVALLSITTCYADSESKATIVYNTKDLGISTIKKDGEIYIPIIEFGENLHYKVTWDLETQTVRIYDNLSDIYLNINGDIKVNDVESKSEKSPILLNEIMYVPLSFVSGNLGIDVNYNEENTIITMTGRDIYGISQTDPTKPCLIAYTKDGQKQVAVVTEKGEYNTETYIANVERTKYSDIVTTSYIESGAVTVSVDDYMYIKDAEIIDNSNKGTSAYMPYSGELIGTRYYDDRVAVLNYENDRTYVKIYNDITGELITKIDTKELYKKDPNYQGHEYDPDSYGEVYNIQAVGNDFLVVSMYQPFVYAKDKSMSIYMEYYYTTVINLETLEIYPVYKNLSYFKELSELGGMKSGISILGDTDVLRSSVWIHGLIPNDYVYFDGIQEDGKLKFVGHYNKDGIEKDEACTVNYKDMGDNMKKIYIILLATILVAILSITTFYAKNKNKTSVL